MDERYTRKDIKYRGMHKGREGGRVGGVFICSQDCSVRGWFIQIIQEGREASLRDHISLKGVG